MNGRVQRLLVLSVCSFTLLMSIFNYDRRVGLSFFWLEVVLDWLKPRFGSDSCFKCCAWGKCSSLGKMEVDR